MGPDQKEWADRLESERDNLRAALQRLADDGLTERALDMGAALWRFWQMRGNLAEGRATLEELLARPDASVPTLGRARALSALGGLAYWQSDMAAAEARLRRRAGDRAFAGRPSRARRGALQPRLRAGGRREARRGTGAVRGSA